jgi:hypothetical protein
MISSENRFPVLGIMLQPKAPTELSAVNVLESPREVLAILGGQP